MRNVFSKIILAIGISIGLFSLSCWGCSTPSSHEDSGIRLDVHGNEHSEFQDDMDAVADPGFSDLNDMIEGFHGTDPGSEGTDLGPWVDIGQNDSEDVGVEINETASTERTDDGALPEESPSVGKCFINGDLESGDQGWTLEYTHSWSGTGSATVVNDSTQAHAGTGAIRLVSNAKCDKAEAVQIIPYPHEAGEVRFWYRAPDLSRSRAYVGATLLPAVSEWTQHVEHSNPSSAVYFRVVVFGELGTCSNGDYGQDEVVWIDDVEFIPHSGECEPQ